MASSTTKSGDVELIVSPTQSTNKTDDLALARLGKKAVLKRRFGFLSILGFSCTVLITWEGSLVLFLVGFQNGGPAGVIYGYLTVWVGTVSVFMVLRWLTLCGWLASLGSGAFLTGGLIQGLLMLCQPDTYVPQNWHVTLLYWAIIAFCVFINIAAGWLLPKFEGALLVLHILGFFAILIPLLVLGPQGNAKEIFTTFVNMGGWQSQGLSFCVGIMGSVFAFVGGDGPIHLSEEIHNAQVVVPRSIMTGIAINGSLGFAMILTVLLRMGNLDEVLDENPAFPFMAIFHRAVQSRSGAAVMASIVMVLTISANVGFSASTSRICWAFARDRGLPGWRTLSKACIQPLYLCERKEAVSDRTSIPVYAVAFTSFIACLLALVNIGSTIAFNGVISVAIAGLFSSYLLTSSLLLYRRCTGAILTPSEAFDTDTTSSSTTRDGMARTVWGPWRLPGAIGIANNVFACAYLSFVFFFSFWPSFAAVTPANMNWAVLVTGAIAGISAIYYAVWARKTYHGPIIEIDERDLSGRVSVIEQRHELGST
ncbi:unnamed protein product [Alternaria alternata]